VKKYRGEQRYSSTHSKPGCGGLHAPTTLPSENKPGTHRVGGWLGSRDGLGTFGEQKMSCLRRDSSSETVQHAASSYTDWAIPVPSTILCQVNNTEQNCRIFIRTPFNVVCFLLGNSPASEFYMPTFRNTYKKTYNIQNTAKVWNQENSLQDFI
jgi:hypothetical protein